MAFKVDDERTVGTTEYGRDELRVRCVKANGEDYVDVRKWYPDKATGEMKPGKGLFVRYEEVQWVVDQLLKCEDVLVEMTVGKTAQVVGGGADAS